MYYINSKITSKQFMIFIITAQIGVGVLTLPSALAKETGHDGWISVVLTGFLSTIVLLCIMTLLKRYSDKSIIEINKLIFGKYLGTINNLIIISYCVFTEGFLLRDVVFAVQMTLLKFTPEPILIFLVAFPTVYLCWYGIKNYCRYGSIIIFLLFIILIIYSLTIKDFRITSLKPMGYAGITSITKGIGVSIFSYLGIELAAIFYPNITDKEKSLKYAILGNLVSGVFFTAVVLITTGVFGENLLKHLVDPLINIPRIVRIPYIERIDIYFIIIWLPVMGESGRAYFIAAFHCIKKVFNFQKSGLPYAVFTCVVFLASRIPRDFDDLANYERILGFIGAAVNLYIVLCLLLSFIIKRGIEDR